MPFRPRAERASSPPAGRVAAARWLAAPYPRAVNWRTADRCRPGPPPRPGRFLIGDWPLPAAARHPAGPIAWPAGAAQADGLRQAEATLVRACRSFAARPARRVVAAAHGDSGWRDARYGGNVLRELDRFLNLLLDEVAGAIGAAGFDCAAFARRTNAAAKLAAIDALLDRAAAPDERLRAIGRLRACLHHCAGRVHDPRARADLAIACGRPPAAGAGPLRMAHHDLDRIGLFYHDLAATLVADFESWRQLR